MSKGVILHNLVEKNGKTIKENNMGKKHNIPIGTLVEIEDNEYFEGGAYRKGTARLFVIAHTRDCDGTPLYSLCGKRVDLMEDEIRVAMKLNNEFCLLKEDLSKNMIFNVQGGYVENDFKIVKITDDVKLDKTIQN
jgi:hypothetical protein